MLRQRQPLALVGRADRAAIEPVGPRDQRLVQHPADHLAVLDQERHLVRAHFEHRPAAAALGLDRAEAGVEKPGVMHPELADERIIGQHLGGMVGRHDDRLARRQDVEIVRVEHDPVRAARAAMRIDRLPELARIVIIDPVDIDHVGMPPRLVADQPAARIARDIGRAEHIHREGSPLRIAPPGTEAAPPPPPPPAPRPAASRHAAAAAPCRGTGASRGGPATARAAIRCAPGC